MTTPQNPPLTPDSVRVVLDRVLAGPDYRWADPPPDFFGWVRGLIADLRQWLDQLLADHPVVYWSLLVVTLVVLAAILAHFAVLIWRALRGPTRQETVIPKPVVTVRDAQWHLQRAHELRDHGAFAEAIAHRFMALLLELDRISVLAFHPAKTPAEYAREVPGSESSRQGFRNLVTALYACLFGGSECTSTTWFEFDALADDVRRSYASH